MARYKIIAHLINPSLQDDKTLTDEYINDYDFIRNGGKQAIGYFMEKYPIDSNAYENLNSTNEYEIEEDADGIYLFKKCENVTESKRKKVKLTETQLKQIVAESVKRVLKEMDEFTPHGYKGMNNYGGNEIQISDSGDSARLKFQDGEVTDWLEIEFDEDGVAYVTTPYGEQEKLSDYMRY